MANSEVERWLAEERGKNNKGKVSWLLLGSASSEVWRAVQFLAFKQQQQATSPFEEGSTSTSAAASLIHRIEFTFEGSTLELFWLRNPHNRKRWRSYFEGCTVLCWAFSSDDYDRPADSAASPTTTKLLLERELFIETASDPCFRQTAVVVINCTSEIFQEKASRGNLSKFFPEYPKGCDPDAAREYLKQNFIPDSAPFISGRSFCSRSWINTKETEATTLQSILLWSKKVLLDNSMASLDPSF